MLLIIIIIILARELKKPWNMKVTIIPIGIGTLIKSPKDELRDFELTGRVETIQTPTLLRTARILRRVLETCCHSNSNESPSAYADVKNSQGFLSLRVFGVLSSFLLLFPQRFGRYVLRPSSGVCRTWEPSRNFELHP